MLDNEAKNILGKHFLDKDYATKKSGDLFNNKFLDDLNASRMRAQLMEQSQEETNGVFFDFFNCERLFISAFLTDAMANDFPLIIGTFLKQENGDIEKYMEMEYVSSHSFLYPPSHIFYYTYLNAVYEAYKQGSVTAKDLLVHLYKNYHKQEYNRLKKYREVRFKDLDSITDIQSIPNASAMSFFRAASRVICVAKILGITLARDCDRFHFILNEFIGDVDDMENSYLEDQDRIFGKVNKKLTDECLAEAEGLLARNKELDKYEEQSIDIASNILVMLGYPVDYLATLQHKGYTPLTTYCKSILLYHLVTGNYDYDVREITLIATMYHSIDILLYSMSELQNAARGITNSEWYREVAEENCLFRPESLPQRTPAAKTEQSKSVERTSGVSSDVDTDALLAELVEVRNKLHMSESAVKQLKSQASDMKRRLHTIEEENSSYEEERKELIALREYVYNMTEKEDSAPSYTTAAMKEALAKKSILIVGGHSNWVGKLKNEFPNWKFVAPNVSNTVSVSLIKNADKVYFFTDTLGHSNYHKFLNSIREQEVPFGYIHGVNITANIQYLYNDLCSND